MAKRAREAALRSIPTEPEVTIAIVSSNASVRAAAAAALTRGGRFAIDGSGSVEEIMGGGGPAVDVLVLHCTSFGSEQSALVQSARADAPEVRVVVICESANGRNARRAVDAGVDGLVFEDQVDDALAATISASLAGMTVVPRALRASARNPSLSFREKQILGMVVMGFTNNEIGHRLYLAESTVKSHLSSAFSKLGVRSRSEAAAMILDPQGSLGTGILAITSDAESPAA